MGISKTLGELQNEYRKETACTLPIRDLILLGIYQQLGKLVNREQDLDYDEESDLGNETPKPGLPEALNVLGAPAGMSHVGPYGYGQEPFTC